MTPDWEMHNPSHPCTHILPSGTEIRRKMFTQMLHYDEIFTDFDE